MVREEALFLVAIVSLCAVSRVCLVRDAFFVVLRGGGGGARRLLFGRAAAERKFSLLKKSFEAIFVSLKNGMLLN